MSKSVLILISVLLVCQTQACAKTPDNGVSGKSLNKLTSQKEISGWMLVQKSKFFGSAQIFVSNSGVRLRRFRDDMIIVAAPPDWTVYSYKPSSKKIFRADVHNFGAVTRTLIRPGELPKLEKIKGSETMQWNTTVATFKSKPIPFRLDAQYHNVGSARLTYEARLVAAISLNLPNQATKFVSDYFGIPKVDGLPLHFFYTRDAEGNQLDLETERLTTAKLAAKAFEIPTGYTEVSDIRAVNIDKESNKFIQEFAESLGKKK